MFPRYLENVLLCLRERPMTARDIGLRLRITPGAALGRCNLLRGFKAIDRTKDGRSYVWRLLESSPTESS